jgi:hypothetical protein
MKSLTAIFSLTVATLLVGMVYAGPGVGATLPSFSGHLLALASLPAGIQDPAPAPPETPDATKPSEPATPRVSTDISVTHEDRSPRISPLWWAIGALALMVVIVMIAMSARGSGTTVVRG